LMTQDFSKYSTSSVVYRPANMTAEELYEGYIRAWKEFYPKETHEETEDGLLIRTFACFPMNRTDLDHCSGAGWVDAVQKKKAGVAV
ncbi:MAG TPA: hypothetical protein VEP69_04050, partial [Thermodesulfovibrionales bacterium]|nr:hypothetical protein [Thermodesulfovibrionales bacterium]